MRPVRGLTANCDVRAARLDADLADDRERGVAQQLVLLVGQRLRRRHRDESPVCTPIASMFSIEQMMTTLSAVSRMTSSSYSFQPSTDSSTRISPIMREVEATPRDLLELIEVVGDAAARAAERVGRANDAGQPDVSHDFPRLVDGVGERAARDLEADVRHRQAKLLAALGLVDRLAVAPIISMPNSLEHALVAELQRRG
jgi:hypothetical protein